MGRRPRLDTASVERVNLRVTSTEMRVWKDAARAQGITLSEFIRRSAERRVGELREKGGIE